MDFGRPQYRVFTYPPTTITLWGELCSDLWRGEICALSQVFALLFPNLAESTNLVWSTIPMVSIPGWNRKQILWR